jgi:hypothetical protein
MTKPYNRWYTGLLVVILLLLAGFLVWGIVRLWMLFWDYISHSQPTVGAAIIAGSFTFIVSVLSFVLTRAFEKNKELAQRRWEQEQELRKQYIPIYQELVEFLFKLLRASKTEKPMSEEEMSKFFVSFTQKTVVWGSDKFIKDFSEFRESSAVYAEQATGRSVTTDDLIHTMVKLENLLYSIRADCGHENKGLGKGDLLTLFINDLRNYIPKQLTGSHN